MAEIKRTYWGSGVTYPRSSRFQEVLDLDAYSCLAGSADGTMWASEATYSESKDSFARLAMHAIDLDRSLAASDMGYLAAITSMCSGDAEKAGQKNQLILGRYCV
mmetsp:Transcript_25374/g.40882  ORF Transcript_25374/g.40882 Transcript_25374/m.40882 type:complete len:105 (-) Transcript_25374:150-464(-)